MTDFEKEVITRLTKIESAFTSFCENFGEFKETIKNHENRLQTQEKNWEGFMGKVTVICMGIAIIWSFIHPLIIKALEK